MALPRRAARSPKAPASGPSGLTTAALLALPLPLLAQGPSPHDVTTYGVVYRVAAMEKVVPRAGIPFGDGDRALDVYLPPGKPGKPVPVVVFANITGAPFQTWEIYRDWARLVAAHGMAGVVYRNDRADPRKSLDAVLAFLSSKGAEHALDPSRVAIWACSANVSLALPWLMDSPPAAVKAAVLYYGVTQVPALRKDLPVYYVLAGRDGPGLVEGIKALFGRAAREGMPWTMVNAPGLTHAFDALDEGVESKRVVKETVAWLVDRLVSPPPEGPKPSLARAALTHVYGQEHEAAAEEYRKLLQADPKDVGAARGFATSLARAGKSKEAIAELRKAIGQGADDAGMRGALGQSLLATGEIAAGAAELKLAIEKGAHPSIVSQAGMPAYQRHDYAGAVAAWEAVLPLATDAAARQTMLFNMACSHALAGDKEKALARLGEAVDAGFGPRGSVEGDEDLASLRGDARFAAILGRIQAGP